MEQCKARRQAATEAFQQRQGCIPPLISPVKEQRPRSSSMERGTRIRPPGWGGETNLWTEPMEESGEAPPMSPRSPRSPKSLSAQSPTKLKPPGFLVEQVCVCVCVGIGLFGSHFVK